MNYLILATKWVFIGAFCLVLFQIAIPLVSFLFAVLIYLFLFVVYLGVLLVGCIIDSGYGMVNKKIRIASGFSTKDMIADVEKKFDERN